MMKSLQREIVIDYQTNCLSQVVLLFLLIGAIRPQFAQDVRLVNPTSTLTNLRAGRLEVLYNNTWGTVCDDYFTNASARVVCASLGFGRSGSFINNAFGPGSGPIWLDDVNCTGSETDISNCRHLPWGSHNCGHGEDVSISCSGSNPTYADGLRLVNPNSTQLRPSVGRLEVLYNGTWGTVCDDYFTNEAAEIACTRLGFQQRGSIFINNAIGPGTGPIWLDDITCSGREIDIASCPHNPWGSHNCGHQEDVSIGCGLAECTSGQPACDASTTVCFNAIGRNYCSCRKGFSQTSTTFCTDINECNSSPPRCDFSTTSCVNTIGSYYCSCSGGYGPMNSTHCRDIDECSNGQSSCDSITTTCINNVGSYYCSCRSGYSRWNPTSCTDIDECSVGTSQCDAASTACVNTIGSYYCSCRSGYTQLQTGSTYCTDIDECSTGQSSCDSITTICVNTVGSYYCSCRSGYNRLNPTSCTDIDECSAGTSQCDAASTACVNTIGSYYCSCRSGYTQLQTGSTYCTDKDECATGDTECDSSSTQCANLIGSYSCSCKNGFKLFNETACLDIDECVSGESNCSNATTVCSNSYGNYECLCQNGFEKESDFSCKKLLFDNRLAIIVGAAAGAFVVVIAAIILLSICCWKRRKQARLKQQTESTGSIVETSSNTKDYETLNQATVELKETEPAYAQLNAATLLPVPPKKPKKISQENIYDNPKT